MLVTCPCCEAQNSFKTVYEVDSLPVLNNVVYNTKEEALKADSGKVTLGKCSNCHFIFNQTYDSSIIDYCEHYNSARRYSKAYLEHSQDLVKKISKHVSPSDKIIELGCGDGDFLRILHNFSGAVCTGYDPSLKGKISEGNIKLFNDYFYPDQADSAYQHIILRHVLEHIADPRNFLSKISKSLAIQKGSSIWIEVPAFEWIVENQAFYDITYEHCNYFTQASLAYLLASLGFEIQEIDKVFSGQYLLLHAKFLGLFRDNYIVDQPRFENICSIFEKGKSCIFKILEERIPICVWGASGKGVIFLSGLDMDKLDKISAIIDINPEKQGKFTPISAKKIEAPKALKKFVGSSPKILIMNSIYKKEIMQTLKKLELNFTVQLFN